MRICLALALSLLSTQLQAQEPQPYRAEYQLKALGQVAGSAQRSLEKTADGWRLKLDSSAQLLFFRSERRETSLMRYADAQWQPLRYEYRDESASKTKSGAQRYDWTARSLTGDKEGRAWTLPLNGPSFDMASYQQQLAEDLAAGKTPLEYTILHRGRSRLYRFAARGRETLDTPAGQLDTLKVEMLDAKGGEDSTTIWFAPSLGYVPARIQRSGDGGMEAELLLSRYERR
ncbi:MAG: DUF3108 domain-containing protein [Gammaproteobacteria bacterium]|nr:DUF3108 domain-containing protein [Gammaproteobacteria bacterium]